jgi:hypothetical protein
MNSRFAINFKCSFYIITVILQRELTVRSHHLKAQAHGYIFEFL